MFLDSLFNIFIALDILAIIALAYRIYEGFAGTATSNEIYLSNIISEQDELIAEYEDIFEFQQTFIVNLQKFYTGQLTEAEMLEFLEHHKDEITIEKENE
jgi:hypothetical protein